MSYDVRTEFREGALVTCGFQWCVYRLIFQQVLSSMPTRLTPATPLFPCYSTKLGRFVRYRVAKFRTRLAALMIVATHAHNATLAAFRHVLETNIGYGDVEETQQVSVVLCHSTTTALQRYDRSAREGKRTQGITNIIRWLGCARPPSILALPERGSCLRVAVRSFFLPRECPFFILPAFNVQCSLLASICSPASNKRIMVEIQDAKFKFSKNVQCSLLASICSPQMNLLAQHLLKLSSLLFLFLETSGDFTTSQSPGGPRTPQAPWQTSPAPMACPATSS